MQYVNATIALALLGFALLRDAPGEATMFIVGALLAAIAFKHWLSTWMVRMLAIVAAGTMFSYFAHFFALVPALHEDWYLRPGEASDAFGLLFASFAMIPVLSEYSCRMKASAECERGRRQSEERKPPPPLAGAHRPKPPLAGVRRPLAPRQTL